MGFFSKAILGPQASACYTVIFFLQNYIHIYTPNHSGVRRGLAAFRLIRSSIFLRFLISPALSFRVARHIFPFSTTINLAPSPESRVPLAVRVVASFPSILIFSLSVFHSVLILLSWQQFTESKWKPEKDRHIKKRDGETSPGFNLGSCLFTHTIYTLRVGASAGYSMALVKHRLGRKQDE